jgi:GT2 family glycosyltransferase
MATIPEVSIIIINYNAGPYLKQCLQSVWEQTFTDYETIVVDNASADNSLSTVAEDKRLTIIRNNQNLGFATAQNQGMRLARGRYLMPLNFDIILAPTFLQEMVAAIEQSEQIGAVSGKLLRMQPNGQPTGRIDNAGLLMPRSRFPVHRGAGEIDRGQYDQPALVFGAMGAAALYRREMLDDIAYQGQFFDESFFMWYEEIDLDWRARLRGWDCLYTPAALAYHVGDAHGHGRSRFGAEVSMRNRWRTILSNECPRCLLINWPWLIAEEIFLLRHVLVRGWLTAYIRALGSFMASLPATLKKRSWVRKQAKRVCLPRYPITMTGE